MSLNYTLDRDERQLDNLNPAANNTHQLIIPDFEGLNFFLQSFQLPSVMAPKVNAPYMGVRTSLPADSVTYGDFTCEILVDEDLSNYTALHEWLVLEAYKNKPLERMVDVTLIWKNRNHIPVRNIIFTKAYLTDLGSLSFQHNNQQAEVMTCSLTFAYQYMSIEKVSQ